MHWLKRIRWLAGLVLMVAGCVLVAKGVVQVDGEAANTKIKNAEYLYGMVSYANRDPSALEFVQKRVTELKDAKAVSDIVGVLYVLGGTALFAFGLVFGFGARKSVASQNPPSENDSFGSPQTTARQKIDQ